VENDIQQRTVDLQSAVVMDETQLPEAVHEKAHSRAGSADHLGQGFLTDLRNHGFWHALLAEMSEQQKDAGQSFFAGVKKVIDQILFVADISRK